MQKQLLIASIFILLFQSFILHADKKKAHILVVDSYFRSMPWSTSFWKGLESAARKHRKKIHYYIEYLDRSRFKKSVRDREWLAFINHKYRGIKIDIILCNSTFATDLLNNHYKKFDNLTPIIYYSTKPLRMRHNNGKIINIDISIPVGKTAEMALNQNPDTRELVLVTGPKFVDDVIIATLKAFSKRRNLKFKIIDTITVGKMLKSVKQLSKNSILFYSIVMWDHQGTHHIPKKILSRIAAVSPVPVYTFWSPLIDTGVVGGYMIDAKTIASQMVQAGFDYLKHQKFRKQYEFIKGFCNWPEVERYRIDEDNIPGDVTVLNKPRPFWEIYFVELMELAALIAIILFLMIYLWNRSLKKANKKLIVLNDEVTIAKEHAEQEARTDLLTGLSNRLAFFEKGGQVCREIRRLEKPVALLMLDIDDFKQINDTYGHDQGDCVIKKLAEVIKTTKRGADIGVRFGGEEFVVVLPFTDHNGAALLAERIRQKVEASVIHYNEQIIKFTVSIGIYSAIPTHCDLNRALKYADDAMYEAKKTGKNRIVIHRGA